MKTDKINIVCTDAKSEMQENLYEFQCGYNKGCCEVITYLKLITHGSISNKDLDDKQKPHRYWWGNLIQIKQTYRCLFDIYF